MWKCHRWHPVGSRASVSLSTCSFSARATDCTEPVKDLSNFVYLFQNSCLCYWILHTDSVLRNFTLTCEIRRDTITCWVDFCQMFQGLLLLMLVTYIDAVCRINYLYLSSFLRVCVCCISWVGWLIRTECSCSVKSPNTPSLPFFPPLFKKALYKPAFLLEKVRLDKLCKHWVVTKLVLTGRNRFWGLGSLSGSAPYQPLASESSGRCCGRFSCSQSLGRHVADNFCGYLNHNFTGGGGLGIVFLPGRSRQWFWSGRSAAVAVTGPVEFWSQSSSAVRGDLLLLF